MGKTPIKQRVNTWLIYARSQGFRLQRVLVHEDDYLDARKHLDADGFWPGTKLPLHSL